MLKSLRYAVLITIATLAGNWLGSRVRGMMTGRPEPGLMVRFEDADGTRYANVPVMTKFYPAFLVAWLSRRPWPYAVLAGALTGALLDEELERRVAGRILPAIADRSRRANEGLRSVDG